MTKVIKEIEVDVAHQNSGTTIVAKQGDMNSRFLKITVTNNGIPINIDPAATVTINARRMDGSPKKFLGQIDNSGRVDMEINSWMLELSGIVKCDISIMKDEAKLTSFEFFVDSVTSACPTNEISNTDDFDILDGLISRVEKLSEKLSFGKKEVIEGYLNSSDGLFYEDNDFKEIILGEDGVIYIDLRTDSTYRFDNVVGYIKISTSEDVANCSDEVYILKDEETEEDVPEDIEIVVIPDENPEIIDWTGYYTKKEIDEIIIRADFKKGKSAYEIALDNGFIGSEKDWIDSLHGTSFTYDDFTEEQLDSLRFKYEDFTEEQLTYLKGASFKYEDFTEDQLADLKFKFEDFTSEELSYLKGSPFRYEDFTVEQLEALKPVKGRDYFDGYTPQKNIDYFDGYTPVRGTDYWTDSDIALIRTFIDIEVSEIVDGSPEKLNTLKELAAALGNDPNFATTVLDLIGQKVQDVPGKGLSSNDYTTQEKEKLAELSGKNLVTLEQVQEMFSQFAKDYLGDYKWRVASSGDYGYVTIKG